MKERPIIFSGPMIKAILAGTKVQTRRIVKLLRDGSEPIQCPFGVTGTRLWVRETWSRYRGFAQDEKPDAPVLYLADRDECGQFPCMLNGNPVRVNVRSPWRSPLHMPRWASRITLEIASVRVERVQQISEPDAIAEGFAEGECRRVPGSTTATTGDGWLPQEQFRMAWDKMHGRKPGHAWTDSPWVWVIGFRRVEGERA